jgi:Fe-S-cluster containining protein
MQSQLHIPQGIRFQCTACGHCCHQYPVPLTDDDVKKLEAFQGEAVERSISRLSQAERSQSGLAAFTYSLDKPDGSCTFLTDEKKCRVHDTAKPAMCRLFPYTFMHCPDGLKVGLSFASTGVLLNNGPKLLVEQEDVLRELGRLFDSMHPELASQSIEKWQSCEFVTGSILDYGDFTEFNQPYLARLEKMITAPRGTAAATTRDTAQAVLADMFDVLCGSLPVEMHDPLRRRFPHISVEKLDQYILMPLYRAYFAAPLSGAPVRDEEISAAVMTYLQNEEKEMYFKSGGSKVTFADLAAVHAAPLNFEEQDLLNRFVYVRLFTRLYFGPGLSMMPLLSGMFHLATVVNLVALALKLDALSGKQRTDQLFYADARFDRVLSIVREIDRRLTAVVYSRNTCSMFELFALDPQRVRRFMSLAN